MRQLPPDSLTADQSRRESEIRKMAAKSDALVMSQSSRLVATSEMLIELVRNHPILFDKCHVKHEGNVT